MSPREQIGRLAMRVEGDWWVAYYAMPETMDGAIELARIDMGIVVDPRPKSAFMDIMRGAVTDIIKERCGATPQWPEPEGRPAPEHERSGRA